jgi:cell division protease FtsH
MPEQNQDLSTEGPKQGTGKRPSGLQLLPLPLLWLAVLVVLWMSFGPNGERQEISYSEFKRSLAAGEVAECVLSEGAIEGRIAPADAAAAADEEEAEDAGEGEGAFLFRSVRVEDPGLVDELMAADVPFSAKLPSVWSQTLVIWLIPLLLLFALWMLLLRGQGMASQSAVSFGKSRAKLVADREVGVSFADVAGCEEAKSELREVVEFLKDPDRFTRYGARVPHGLLLVGPPGTGKTLMARAVAGEAGVPFFSLSGSDFVEMFVGVGAARVRDLFHQAKKIAPCIIFMDELDAIGRRRGVHVSNVNDEREHTLNQLLVELDGFESDTGVILLSATNRPDVLDPALLRPGRFDRQVILDAPDFEGRKAILRVHARGKPIAPGVEFETIARSTPGFSGADLANAVNEAALLAARRGGPMIQQADLEQAVEKVVAGPERKSRRLSDVEKRRVAYHESGHALVAAHCKHADPVHKISIVPRGRAALGYTLQLPTGDRHLVSRSELTDRLRSLMGGRAAEELVLGEVSTGSENDLAQATHIARQIICQFGMGESVGLMHVVQDGGLAGDPAAGWLQRDCSEDMARAIDEEVKQILEQAHADACDILADHRDQLYRVAERLLERESIEEAEFRALLISDDEEPS